MPAGKTVSLDEMRAEPAQPSSRSPVWLGEREKGCYARAME